MPQEKRKVFRIANLDSERGLWYNPKGDFKGEIHKQLDFCRASAYQMPFNKNLSKVWRSATSSANELLVWFNLEELAKLEEFGFYVAIYETTEYKNHLYIDPNSGAEIEHLIFKIDASKLVELVTVDKFKQMLDK